MGDAKKAGVFSLKWLDRFIPKAFATGAEAFAARTLVFYCLAVGGSGFISMFAFVAIADGDFPPRRMGSLALICLLLSPIIFIQFVKNLKVLSIYVMSLTIMTIYYVDYNNQSVSGPATVLWVLPPALAVLLFKVKGACIVLIISACLMLLNFYLLKTGQLPPSIVRVENWPAARIAVQIISTGLIILCTFGLSSIVFKYSRKLESELANRKQRIKEIAILKERAEESARSKTVFLATMSHELRTPLNSVIGNTQLLAREELSDRVRERVGDISIAGNLLLTLINDVLDFSKLEESKLNLIPEPYNLTEQIKELSRILEPRFKQGVELHLKGLEEVVYVNGDQNRIAQVFMNLLSNAAKFTDAGAVTVTLQITQESINLIFEDSGIGMDEASVNQLFQRFSQVTNDSKRNIEGTGLGLAISKGLVDLMGGEISVSSDLGLGSKFVVSLPIALRVDAPNSSITQEKSKDLELTLEGKHILVVDDVVMNCTVLESMLEEIGSENVSIVFAGQDAIDYVKDHIDVDLIFMDMRMPEMDGLEATQRLRKDGFQGTIIAVTANASEEDREACKSAGMDGFVSKPINFSELEKTLERHL